MPKEPRFSAGRSTSITVCPESTFLCTQQMPHLISDTFQQGKKKVLQEFID